MNALQFEALKLALKQDANGYVLTLKIHPDEIPEQLLRDFVGARYGIAMVRINDDETPVGGKNMVQQAGMVCRHQHFHKFLQEHYDLANVDEAKATEFLYKFCGITSRTELNGKASAKEKFKLLMQEYDEWGRYGEPF